MGAALIIDNEKLLGIITDGDLRRSLGNKKELLKMTSKDIMNKNPLTIRPNLTLGEALKKMENKTRQISVLPVTSITSTSHVLGLLRLHDIYTPNVK